MEQSVQPKKEEWDWRKQKPNNTIIVPVSSDMEFFKMWLTMIHPFVPLTPKETIVVSAYLKRRKELCKRVPSDVVDSLLMLNDTRDKVLEDCHISLEHFYVVVSGLKKKQVITPRGINPKLIPDTRESDNGVFKLQIVLKEEQK